MQLANTTVKRMLLATVLVPVLAGFVLFFLPQEANAATIRWVNRWYIQVDDKYYFDSNTYDDVYEYVEQGSPDSCPDRIRFTILQFGYPTSPGERTNLRFFYDDNYYSDSGQISFKKERIIRELSRETISCTERVETIDPSSPNNRRVTFYFVNDNSLQVKHISTGATFERRGAYPPNANPGFPRYFRMDQAAAGDTCVDMIIQRPARVLDSGMFNTGPNEIVPGSSILFSVSDRQNLSRKSESYAPNSGRSDVNQDSCRVNGGAINGRDTANRYGIAGFSSNALDKYILAAGVNPDGNNATGSPYDDDAFVIFIGTESANMRKDAEGNTVTTPTQEEGSELLDDTACRGNGLGWIICPLVDLIRGSSELLREALEVMLNINPLPLDENAPLYRTWMNIRDASMILFMVILSIAGFSQITSLGINNLGLKRIAAKLLIVPIGVYISYPAAAFVIDASNILGVGMFNLVATLNDGRVGGVEVGSGAAVISTTLIITVIAAAIRTGTIVNLFPFLIAGLISVIILFLALAARIAIITVLSISFSPLLVLWIIKESFLINALKMFFALNAIYAGVMLGFGASYVIVDVISQSADESSIGGVLTQLAMVAVQVLLCVMIVSLVRTALIARARLDGLARKVEGGISGLTSRAQKAAQNTSFYQRRRMASEARDAERTRRNVADYAATISSDTWRGRNLRRRAAGGIAAQIAGAVPVTGVPGYEVNGQGQERLRIAGQTQLDKLEQQEIGDSSFILRRNNIQAPDKLVAVAKGGKVEGIDANGRTVIIDSTGNKAMQRAAMRELINMQDSGSLEDLFKDNATDRLALTNEIASNYSNAKGAGAHLVKLKARSTPYTSDELAIEAVQALSALAPEKLAAQDTRAVQSAAAGFAMAAPTTMDAAQQAKFNEAKITFRNTAAEIMSNTQLRGKAKKDVREELSRVSGVGGP